MIDRIALLAGLFVVPVILLVVAHGVRNLSETAKLRFWGGVIGHIAGLSFAVISMLLPPVLWAGGNTLRAAAVHWSMILGFLLGVIAGPLVLRRPQ